jgi:hypothetical protein
MAPRTCSHIKENGIKCGSPALKYHTLCYFHYQWRRRIREGSNGSVGHFTALRLPPLESKASLIMAIVQIQAALLDGCIDNKVAKTLLYGVQLAIQVKASDREISSPEGSTFSNELRIEMEAERLDHNRPPLGICDACKKSDECRSTADCPYSQTQIRELERIADPEAHAKTLARDQEAKRLYDTAIAPLKKPSSRSVSAPKMPSTRPESRSDAVEEPAVLHASSTPAVTGTTLHTCHPVHSATPPREVAGPFVSSTPARPSTTPATSTSSSTPLRESRPARECGISAEPTTPSRATARRRKLFHSSVHFDQLKNRALNEINILKPNS